MTHKTEAIVLFQIFNLLGKPNEDSWPGFSRLPLTRTINPIGPPWVSDYLIPSISHAHSLDSFR